MSPSIARSHQSPATVASAQSVQAAPAASVQASVVTQSGDLDRGSLVHQLPIGGHLLVVHYWSDSTLPTESAGGDVVHLSAELKGADRQHAVKVTRFAASLDTVTGSGGAGPATVPLADDQGEFVLTPPYSYTSALALPVSTSLAAGATRTLSLRFDLLLETAPGSGSYFRQSVLDKVVLTRGIEGATP